MIFSGDFGDTLFINQTYLGLKFMKIWLEILFI